MNHCTRTLPSTLIAARGSGVRTGLGKGSAAKARECATGATKAKPLHEDEAEEAATGRTGQGKTSVGDSDRRAELGATAAAMQGEEASFVQFAYIFQEGRALLTKWRRHQEEVKQRHFVKAKQDVEAYPF